MSTLSFYIAHFFHYLVFGLAFVGLSLFALLGITPAPTSPFIDAALYAPGSALLNPIACVALVIGIVILVMGWFKASNLRTGR